jgi:hypothetical protein
MKRVMLIGLASIAIGACSQPGPGESTTGTGTSSTGNGGSNTGTGGGGAGGSGNAGTGNPSTGNGGGGAGAGGNTTSGDAGAGGSGGNGPGSGGGGSGGIGSDAGSGIDAGTGGGAADAGGGGPLSINDIVPGLDGYYWEVTPSGNTALSGTNYPFGPPAGGCPSGATWDTTGYINTRPVLNVRGTTGQKYTVNVNVRGVVGTRCYTGGIPGSTAAGNPSGPNNTWYAGGQQFNDTFWNTMEIRVAPKVLGQPMQMNGAYDVYFANSFQNTANWCQKEASYETRYNASFPVMGGGTISFVVHDSNCRTLANCGAVENQTSCDTTASRIIDLSGVSPAPMNFTQPRTGSLGGSTYYLQWIWIDVTSLTSP